MAQSCPTKTPSFRSWTYPKWYKWHTLQIQKMRFQLRPVCHLYPSQIRFWPCRGTHLRRNRHTMSHPIHRLPYSCRPKRTRYNDVTNVTGISYENVNRESCVSPLTKAKLTRSCADPNPGAIKYIQFTTGIALEETERCKQLALEHHKMAQIAGLAGPQCRFSCKTSGKAARDLRRFPRACPGLGPG